MNRNETVVATALGNQIMIDACKAGLPVNGKPVPYGAKIAKIHWSPKPNEFNDAFRLGERAERLSCCKPPSDEVTVAFHPGHIFSD